LNLGKNDNFKLKMGIAHVEYTPHWHLKG